MTLIRPRFLFFSVISLRISSGREKRGWHNLATMLRRFCREKFVENLCISGRGVSTIRRRHYRATLSCTPLNVIEKTIYGKFGREHVAGETVRRGIKSTCPDSLPRYLRFYRRRPPRFPRLHTTTVVRYGRRRTMLARARTRRVSSDRPKRARSVVGRFLFIAPAITQTNISRTRNEQPSARNRRNFEETSGGSCQVASLR